MKRVTYVNILLSAVISAIAVHQSTFAANCPCDIYAAGGTPCVAAHSTTRALYASYNGPLYQVRRTSDNQLRDIGVTNPGGFANAAVQDSFLKGQTGTISKIYDQSPKANHLIRTPKGGWLKQDGKEASATGAKIMVNGYPVYGIYIKGTPFGDNSQGMGYRNNSTQGVATGNQAEGMYMVVSGKHYNGMCCFDYGNAQTNNEAKGPATMESLYFGNSKQWGYGSGNGPWVMSDPEFGLQAGVDPNGTVLGVWAGNTSIVADYVMGTIKSTTENFWALRGADANTGKLKTMYSGRQYPGYYPKKLEGAIVLGIGGDNSTGGDGTFFEGAMVIGCPSDSIEDLVKTNIIAAGYGRSTTPTVSGPAAPVRSSMFNVTFNPSARSGLVSYTLQDNLRVSIGVFDRQGRLVASVFPGIMPTGRHAAVWDAKHIPAGVYVCRVAVDGRTGWAGKVVVVK